MCISLRLSLVVAAIGLFCFYLYAPVYTPAYMPGLPDTLATYYGRDVVRDALSFNEINQVFRDQMPASPSAFYWEMLVRSMKDAFVDGLLILGCVGLSQLPYLCSRRLTLSRSVQMGLVAFFVASALATLYRACFWEMFAPDMYERRYGTWLPPIFFGLAAAAVIVPNRSAPP
jgi:hypothetical protein